jgi:glutamine amidotransferase
VSGPETLIIDSGGANVASLLFAFERLGAPARLSRDPYDLERAERAVLPGVGAADDAMARLAASGLDAALRGFKRPLLGICLGMQLLFDRSDEGDTPALGLIPGKVTPLVAVPTRPVPHMGWNTIATLRADPLLAGIGPEDWFYFVHGYHAAAIDGDPALLASVDYGTPIAAVVRRDNCCGVQFHPERSGASGARLLRNFLAIR